MARPTGNQRFPGRPLAAGLTGFVVGAVVAWFLVGPAMLADGSLGERLATGLAAIAVVALVGFAAGRAGRSRWAAVAPAAGPIAVAAILFAAEPDAWPIALLVWCGSLVAALAAMRAPWVRGNH